MKRDYTLGFRFEVDVRSDALHRHEWGWTHRGGKRSARAQETKIQQANIRRTLGIRDILFLRLCCIPPLSYLVEKPGKKSDV